MKTASAWFAMLLSVYGMANHLALADTFGGGANEFTIDFVTIGNPGNPADTTGNPNPAGSVPYPYRMGKYEISRDMLEKANAAGNLGITLDPMDVVTGGPRTDMPATGLSWNEAARFVNWLNTSQGFPAAYKFSTQPGDQAYAANDEHILHWQPSDPGFDATNWFRNSLARYVLPTADEWYKAAYYDPTANGGAGGWSNYPTGGDTPPAPVAGGTDAGTAVFLQPREQGPADVTNAGGLGPYGVMGMGGNVWEWEETQFEDNHFNPVNDGSSLIRGMRGGAWHGPDILHPLTRLENGFTAAEVSGVRVASVPEPASLLLLLLAGVCAMGSLKGRQRGGRTGRTKTAKF